MTGFLLKLQDATHTEEIAGVSAFWGVDGSGSFTLWPGHVRMMTSLEFGLARFRKDGGWEYLALPRALLYFVDNQLFIGTRRYVRDHDLDRISSVLESQLAEEERQLHQIHQSLRKMEEEMFKRLWQLGRRHRVG